MKTQWNGGWLRWQACIFAVLSAAVSFGPASPAQAASPRVFTLDASGAATGLLQADPCASADVQMGGGGANDIVLLHNQVDGGLTARGKVQINQIPGPTVAPVNCAFATSTCIACQTLSVALQIDLISPNASSVAPRNIARAQNVGCQGCQTFARALQYVIQVDDPTSTPPEIGRLAQAMNEQLRAVQTDRSLTLDQAVAQIEAVLAQFEDLAASLDDQRSQAVN
jgi:hypothetical protein